MINLLDLQFQFEKKIDVSKCSFRPDFYIYQTYMSYVFGKILPLGL